MWNERLAALTGAYPTGILSVIEPSGYPASVRCVAQMHAAEQTFTFPDIPAFAADWQGKACLLFHRHDARLEGLHQMVARGELERIDGVLTLRVGAFVTANGRQDSDEMPHASAPLRMMQFLLLGRRKAKSYIKKRGAPWPPIVLDVPEASTPAPAAHP